MTKRKKKKTLQRKVHRDKSDNEHREGWSIEWMISTPSTWRGQRAGQASKGASLPHFRSNPCTHIVEGQKLSSDRHWSATPPPQATKTSQESGRTVSILLDLLPDTQSEVGFSHLSANKENGFANVADVYRP